jgi:hypothetical protein
VSTDEPTAPPPGAEEPSPEELMEQFARRLGRTPVPDVLLQTMATLTDMAGIRLGLGPEGDEVRDLAQARLAIESMRALASVTEALIGPAQARMFREPLSQLQLAYAQIAQSEGAPAGPGAGREPSAADPEPPPPAPPPAAGPDPASKLWVPPGTRRSS